MLFHIKSLLRVLLHNLIATEFSASNTPIVSLLDRLRSPTQADLLLTSS